MSNLENDGNVVFVFNGQQQADENDPPLPQEAYDGLLDMLEQTGVVIHNRPVRSIRRPEDVVIMNHPFATNHGSFRVQYPYTRRAH